MLPLVRLIYAHNNKQGPIFEECHLSRKSHDRINLLYFTLRRVGVLLLR